MEIRRTTVLGVDRPPKSLSILRQLDSGESHGVEDDFRVRTGFQWRKSFDHFRSVTIDDVQRAGLVSGTSCRVCNEEFRDLSPFRIVFCLLIRRRGLSKCGRG
jgi:hypothetical protein